MFKAVCYNGFEAWQSTSQGTLKEMQITPETPYQPGERALMRRDEKSMAMMKLGSKVDESNADANVDEANVNDNVDEANVEEDVGGANVEQDDIDKSPKRDLTIDKGPKDKFGRRFHAIFYTRTLSNKENCDRECEGYRDWQHVTTSLKEHEVSLEHLKNMASWFEMCQRLKVNETIDKVAYEQFKKERDYWKQVLSRIIAFVKFLGKKTLAFRGTNEKLYQEDNGIFLGLVEMVEEFDPVMKEHVRRITSDEIHVRYLGHSFLIVDDTTGKGISDITHEELKSLGLDINDMRRQGYDNGSNMRGKHQGVQRRFLDINPRAFYTPRGCHSLNLALSNMATTCTKARDGDIKTHSEADTLATKEIGDFGFLVSIVIWYQILNTINVVSKKLQSKEMVLDEAIKEVKNLINFFKEYREVGLSEAIEVAKGISIEMGVDPGFPQRRPILRKKQFNETSREQKIVVDQAISSLESRFEQYNEYEKLFGFLFPKKLKELEDKDLMSCCIILQDALKYGEASDIDAKELYMELKLMNTYLSDEIITFIYALKFLKKAYHYPNALVAYRVLLAIPVTVASAE
ncbi:uncharacterized protein LOC143582989 [Bidens hawaiensis]|uniref:uncharacterized protein LOC143582989 n=1 Tax=Bidens hawaiensis TaxID=980011 RepID=UPI004048EB0D